MIDGVDRYGRLPAQVFLTDGRWVQAEMVAGGHGRVTLEAEQGSCTGRLLALEDNARGARRGLWSEPEYAVRQVDDPSLSGRNGLYEIVEGRVVSVNRGRRMVFVDFGRDYWRDFSVMVPLAALQRFAEGGVPVEDLAGRRIRVRGILEESGGPAMRVYDPVAIEVLDENGTSSEPR
jgi:hypothetical protein